MNPSYYLSKEIKGFFFLISRRVHEYIPDAHFMGGLMNTYFYSLFGGSLLFG